MSEYQKNDVSDKKITEYERNILYAFYGPVPATSNDEAVLFKVKNAVEAAEPELKRLRAENEKLQQQYDAGIAAWNPVYEIVLNERDALRAENDKLRAALKPFADEGAGLTDEHDDLPYDYGMGDCGCFTNGHLRAAAAALKEGDNG